MNYGVIILAAGNSERMGYPKFTNIYDNNISFLENIIFSYKKLGINKIVVVINSENKKYIEKNNINLGDSKLIINKYPEKGRFYSIITGLKYFSDEKAIFLHNSDNPFAEKDVLEKLIENISNKNFVVPYYNQKGGHPILISKKIVDEIKIEKDESKNFKEVLKKFSKKIIVVNSNKILLNINTPEDYIIFRKNISDGNNK